MVYKKTDNSLGFADLALASSLKYIRSLILMNKLNNGINWDCVEQTLMVHYTVGTSGEGADAYPPLLLFKYILLQKWFRINSDPELENQINDRLSFKKFLCLSFDRPSPDHSTFSRFRSRLSKNAMYQINSGILRQFEAKGLTINEGIAVDARLVKSASRPISDNEIDEFKKEQDTPQAKLDELPRRKQRGINDRKGFYHFNVASDGVLDPMLRNKKGNPKKFSCYLDSNWTIKNDPPTMA